MPLEITAHQANRTRHVRPTAEALAALVAGVGAESFIVLTRVPDLPDHFMQVWHEGRDDSWSLEFRDGSWDKHFQTRLTDPAAVAEVMTAWAREADGPWRTDLAWETLAFSAPPPVPPLELDDEARADLESHLRLQLTAGYIDRAGLAEVAEEYLVTADSRPVSKPQASVLGDRLWLARVAEQASWTGETEPERLSRAFAALDATGITAREHFTCCRSCGQAEIGGAGAADARGFVYFHTQCTDSAAAGQGLHLLYGGFDGSEATTAAVGREVRAALEAVGLPVQWDGTPSQALLVTPLDWRKRLVG